jgi:hypothetical protein
VIIINKAAVDEHVTAIEVLTDQKLRDLLVERQRGCKKMNINSNAIVLMHFTK